MQTCLSFSIRIQDFVGWSNSYKGQFSPIINILSLWFSIWMISTNFITIPSVSSLTLFFRNMSTPCPGFAPNPWRKKKCKHCGHSQSSHFLPPIDNNLLPKSPDNDTKKEVTPPNSVSSPGGFTITSPTKQGSSSAFLAEYKTHQRKESRALSDVSTPTVRIDFNISGFVVIYFFRKWDSNINIIRIMNIHDSIPFIRYRNLSNSFLFRKKEVIAESQW